MRLREVVNVLLVWVSEEVVECGCWKKLVEVVIGEVKGKGSCECVVW